MSWIETLREPKILDMSIFDWVISLVVAALVGKWLGIKQWPLFLVVWIAFGIWAHWLFGIKTMLGYYVGLNEKPERK
jgi:uncharacterized membrane protein YcaP (DUF421 family)